MRLVRLFGQDRVAQFLKNAAPEVIGAVALEERVVLTELSAGGAGSLEEMFLELTAATSREGAAA